MKGILVLGVMMTAVTMTAQADLLWEIGTADESAAEFALFPGEYEKFDQDGYFGVGQSDPATDWPYVHPGPADAWAGGKAHTFTIVFHVNKVPSEGKCVLHVSLVDTHNAAPPRLSVTFNGHSLKRTMPPGNGSDGVLKGDKGNAHKFWVSFPAKYLIKGENEITIANKEGSWLVYDWLGLEAPDSVVADTGALPKTRIGAVVSLPVLVEKDGVLKQTVQIPVWHFGEESAATVSTTGQPDQELTLERGAHTLQVKMDAVEQETPVHVALKVEGKTIAEQDVVLQPIRKWEVYLLHHTHLDIGYTHLQTDVERRQWEHLENAIEYARKTADYPEGSQFKWLPEGLWAIDSYLKQAPPEKRDAFVEAVRKGWVGLDALYGNELTALCRPEELLELTAYAIQLSKEYGFTIDSAMITDVPGYTWGMVPALALSGVKYFSVGPNWGHRIGYTISDWGDKPFYWISPSGKHKVLFWIAGKGYSWFHRGPLKEDTGILNYLEELDKADYPYDIVQVRYNIGGDNGPPDPNISDFVRGWNKRYAYPKLILATPTEMCKAFEEKYADIVPEVTGDFTPYWEDGAASSAQETILNRAAAERLVQANALWAMCDAGAYPADAFHAAWREAILYDEHTWGAHNSISEPESEFALGQWAIKQAFALEADKQSKDLLNRAVAGFRADGDVSAVQVFNTTSWPRTDLVVLPKDMRLPGDLVKDAKGKPVPAQRLTTGELAFVAKDVPPIGAAKFTVQEGAAHKGQTVKIKGSQLANETLTLELDEATGAIASLTHDGIPRDFVNRADGLGLNDYFYIEGRVPDNPQRNGKPIIRVGEPGPLVASLIIESDAPGCNKLTREVRLIAGLDRVDLIDNIDKKNIYAQEGVHIAFPFNVPDGVTRMDLPFAVIRPDADQMPGACKNYFTVQRWVDVSNREAGITWATPDAPLVEVGAITTDATRVGWLREVKQPATTLYSYVMNNYWETNYKAGQEGPTLFRYSLRPHAQYDQGAAQRFGVEQGQPLVVVPVASKADGIPSALRVDPPDVMVTVYKPSDDGKARIVRLFNGSDQPKIATLTWGKRPKAIYMSELDEKPGKTVNGPLTLAPYEIMTLRCK